MYENELAIAHALQSCAIPRDQIWVSSKLHPNDMGFDSTLAAVTNLLGKLGLDYLDLFLVHWPGMLDGRDAPQLRVDTWRALHAAVERGLIRYIGVSNYEIEHLEQLLAACSSMKLTRPSVLQSEMHPLLQQRELRQFCELHKILFQAYSPLGGFRSQGDASNVLLMCCPMNYCSRCTHHTGQRQDS